MSIKTSCQVARARLREVVLRLEVPNCRCPLLLSCPCGESCPPGSDCRHCRGECDCPPLLHQSPCYHQLEAGRRCDAAGISFENFTALVRAAFPGYRLGSRGEDGTDDPPSPSSPGVALSHRERVNLMERRARAGVSLWHPEGDQRDGEGTLVETVTFCPANGKREARLGRLVNGAKQVVLLTDEVRRAVAGKKKKVAA